MRNRVRVRVNGREAVFGTGLPEVAVGSDRNCLVRLPDAGVAARHVVLRHTDGAWFAEAVGSAAVFVDGLSIERREIDQPLELRLADPDAGPLIEVSPAGQDGAGMATRDWGPVEDDIRSAVRERPAVSFLLPDTVPRIGPDPSADGVAAGVLVSPRPAAL